MRFAWGLATDQRLNHHPQPPQNEAGDWEGRRFNAARPELYLRIERQTLSGLADLDAVVFTIRTYFENIGTLRDNPVRCAELTAALRSMGDASLMYKGLAADRAAIVDWIER